jgi:Mycothiol maleylpyruvate isomerase N-terminal domain
MSGAREIEDLLTAEEAGWTAIHHLVDALSPDQAETPGYFAEGWSVKDLTGHLGSWLAEAGIALERIRAGTYRAGELDIHAKNDEFLEALRPLTLRETHAQAEAARARMLRTLRSLPDVSGDASWWIAKAGPDHYEAHLPRLRDWVRELRPGG